MNSLRVRLLLWVLLPMLLALAATAWQSWRNASTVAQLVQDHQLLASAQVIAGDIEWRDGSLTAQTPPAALEIFASNAQDRVYFRVQTAAGMLLAGWPDLPEDNRPPGDAPHYADARFRGEAIRVVDIARTLYKDNRPVQVQVSVAETRGAYHDLVQQLWRPALQRESALLVLALVLMLLGLTLELRPLLRLRKSLLARDSTDLSPLRALELQKELRPVVDTLNQYAARLTRQVDLQKRFVADAAHQLRTPVALIATQLDYAARQTDRLAMQDTVQALRTTARHLAQTINQLLNLSQAEAFHTQGRPLETVDLLEVAREVLVELAMPADARRIDLGLNAQDARAKVQAHPALVHAMLFNLVDNAIRYTPQGGSVTVAVHMLPTAVELVVEDTGPGIPAELRPLVFERFQRGRAGDHTGSGLGLAIVREAALACAATVELQGRGDNPGLRVVVRFRR